MTKTLIVVPAYNEEARLEPQKFRKLVKSNPDLEVLFVNDGSSDQTERVLADLSSSSDGISYISLEHNKGKAEAVRRGFLWGLEKSYSYIGYWDADLATPLAAIKDLQTEAQRRSATQVVLGSRVKLMGREIERKAYRHYMGRVFATFVSMTLNLGVYDTQCGAKLFKVNDHLRSSFAEAFVSRWIFDVEILARLKRSGMNLDSAVAEFPLWQWRDIAGSKLKPMDFFKAMWELILIWNASRA